MNTDVLKLNLANKITIARIIMVPLFIWLILAYRVSVRADADWLRIGAAIIFILATLSDALDGFVARTWNQKTELGAILDPIADKLLLMSAVILFSLELPHLFTLPMWFAVVVISRDVIILFGTFLIHFIKGEVKIMISYYGKLTTFFQMMLLFWIILKLPYAIVLLVVATIFTVISGAHYVYIGSKQLA